MLLIINYKFSIINLRNATHFAPFAVEIQTVAVGAVFDEEVATKGGLLAQALPNLAADAVARHHYALATEILAQLQRGGNMLHATLRIKLTRKAVGDVVLR